jgi:hypothetical protein
LTFAHGLIGSAVIAVEINSDIVIPSEYQGVALGLIVDCTGDEGAEDGAPGVEQIYVAADRAKGLAAEEIADGWQRRKGRLLDMYGILPYL